MMRFTLVLASLACFSTNVFAAEGAATVEYYGYDDCIELRNDHVSVVLCPAAGGRVLKYALDGENVLHLPPGSEGWTYDPDVKIKRGGGGPMQAGRFDIGPEKMVSRGNVLWMGRWDGEVTGDRSARLTSQFDPKSGVRLIRDFELDESTSRLECRQTIVNESDRAVSLCHWSRTFAVGNGIAIVPRSPLGRFPNGYVMYEGGNRLQFQPEDANIQVTDDAVVVGAAPAFPKLGFDSHAGWLAYLAPTDQLFVKRFATYPNRSYNEFASLTISVWYPQGDMVELEPIGPAEDLEPSQQASFTEQWWLLSHEFPDDAKSMDFAALQKKVEDETRVRRRFARGGASPEVHEDGRVSFRVSAPNASRVNVVVNNRPKRLARGSDNVWTCTTEPMAPGIYEYTFDIDGARVTDPSNRWVKKWTTCASLFEVPGDEPLLTQQRAVPHGTVHRHLYASKTTGDDRAAVVYTPPGYDEDADVPYPVVVLCHGFGDDETAWTENGRAHHILDNLIANGTIKPMVIVMPNGHPVPLLQRNWSDDYGTRNSEAMVSDIADDLLPLIEEHYNVATSPQQRAIVGLSMGGGHSIMGGMTHADKFAWVGAFSAATPGDVPEGVEVADTDRKLFWIACGTDDFLIERNRSFHRKLDDLGIKHTYVETNGAHSWEVWRDYLPTFLQKLFQD